MKILQGQNNALKVLFHADDDLSLITKLSASLSLRGTQLKKWAINDVTIDNDNKWVALPLSESETMAFDIGDAKLEVKFLDDESNVLFLKRITVPIHKWNDSTVLTDGETVINDDCTVDAIPLQHLIIKKGDKGVDGKDGSDAEVTTENIVNALGYTPANEEDIPSPYDDTSIKEQLEKQNTDIATQKSNLETEVSEREKQDSLLTKAIELLQEAIKGKQDTLTETEKQAIADLHNDLVQDVQINGTSILSDGVANVPIASADSEGVIKCLESRGILVDSSHNAYIYKASNSNITYRNSDYRPIVPTNLVTAVNSVECSTSTSEQLTSEQQKNAQARLGIEQITETEYQALAEKGENTFYYTGENIYLGEDKFKKDEELELINTITLTEGQVLASTSFTSLKKALVVIENGGENVICDNNFLFYASFAQYSTLRYVYASTGACCRVEISFNGDSQWVEEKCFSAINNGKFTFSCARHSSNTVNRFIIESANSSSISFKEGTTIKIYGIKA